MTKQTAPVLSCNEILRMCESRGWEPDVSAKNSFGTCAETSVSAIVEVPKHPFRQSL